jgi:lysophospholipase L1-like esterase
MRRPGTLERAQASTSESSAPGRWRRLAVWAGGALLALLAAEVLMRFYAFAPRVIDGEFGFVPQPGVTIRWYVEGAGRSHWKEHGIRQQDNPAGAPALLMLGDSITEALQVDDDRTFSARLSVRLRERGLPMAVQNAGMQGASIARYASLAPEYRRLLDQRWTVVQFDDDDLVKALSPLETHFVRDAPGAPLRIQKLTLGHGGSLRLRTRVLRAKSALIQRLVLQAMGFADEWRRWRPFHAEGVQPRPNPVAGAQPPVEDELAALAQAYGNRITFLYMAVFDPAHPEATSEIERQVEEVCARRGFSLVNIRRFFPEFAGGGTSPYGLPNAGFNVGHLNPGGHDAVARELARELERLSGHGLL